MKKTSVLKILCILLVVTLTCGLLFSTFGSDDLSETQMQSITFIKTGQVTTLINAGDTYFVKQENFGYDGSYVTPATERQITYQEYTELKANKNYDIYAETQQARVDGLYIDKSLFYHVDGQVITGSYYGRIIDGEFTPIITPNKVQTILLNDGGTLFYVITKTLDEYGNYTNNAVYNMVSPESYYEVRAEKKFDYEIEYTYEYSDGFYKTISYFDAQEDPLIRPIIVEAFGVYTYEDFLEELKPDPVIPPEEPTPGEDPGTTTPPSEGPTTEEPPAEPSKPGPGSPGASLDDTGPWTGGIFNWTDSNTLPGSEVQTWADIWGQATGTTDWYDSLNGVGGDTTSKDNFVDYSDFGYFDDNGDFIETNEEGEVIPDEEGTFDEDGNFIPEDGDSYFDTEGVEHPTDTEDEVIKEEDGTIIGPEGEIIDPSGNVIPEDSIEDPAGIVTPDGGFQQGEEGLIDSEGNVSPSGDIPQEGAEFLSVSGTLLLNEYGQLYIKGFKNEVYDETGLVTRSNGKTGFYDANKKFTSGVTNPEAGNGGFYDAAGKWHLFTEFYRNANGDLKLTLQPAIGMTIVENKINIDGVSYDQFGLTTENDKVGYYNQNGDFIIGTKIPYRNGFFTIDGDWIDSDLYEVNRDNEVSVKNAWFDPHGTFTTISGDRGHFDNTGKFVLGQKNVKGDMGYYDHKGEIHEWGVKYTDSIGFIHITGQDGYFLTDGVTWVDAEVVDGVNDFNGNFHNMFFSYFTPDGTIGHYEKTNVVKGYSIYDDGYFDDKEYFMTDNGTVIVEGEGKHYDKDGVLQPGKNILADGYYNSKAHFMRYNNTIVTNDAKLIIEDGTVIEGTVDENGNIILPDGTVITPDGTIGYYDEDGNFQAGDTILPEGAYMDEDGNIVMPDGTIIMPDGTVILPDGTVILPDGTKILPDGTVILPDGTVGYYDENGNFVEGLPEGAEMLEDGTIILPDGTVILPDGTVILPDGTKILPDGTTILPDGTVILPDGTVGYFDENGNFIEGTPGELEGLPEGAYYDENGNLILPDGTVILPDGTKILPDGTVILPDGTVGYLDENGNFVEGLPEGAYIDENGNIVMPDGTIIMPDGTTILPDGTVILPDGTVGYLDENGNFVEGVPGEDLLEGYPEGTYIDENGNIVLPDGTIIMPDGTKILPDGTVILPDGTVGYYDENGNFVEGLPEGAYIDENGNIVLPDGTVIMPDGTTILPDGTVIAPDGTVGYLDENGNFVEGTPGELEGLPEGAYYDENGNLVLPDGTVILPDGTKILPDGTVILPDGTVGYYDENGNFVEGLPEGAYYDENGNLVMPDGTVIMPDGTTILPDGTVIAPDGTVGYLDENGNFVEGTPGELEGLPEGAYYDENGNLVMPDGTIITPDGTKILPDGTVILPDGTVGYYDENGNFVEGLPEGAYIDENGNIVMPDGTVIMPDGTTILPDGTVIAPDGTVGYYDENGNFVEGTPGEGAEGKPEGGFYDSEGNWTELPLPPTASDAMHYDSEGNLVEGANPYEDGFYDAEGNWHPAGEEYYVDENGNVHMMGEDSIGYTDEAGNFYPAEGGGYYDENGNFHSEDGKVGYYDKDGNFIEGTNPYPDGFYDAEGNWHPNGEEGYYDENGVWHENKITEEIYHYDENGNLVEGPNPYTNGYYDAEGNWHPAGEEYYIDENGNMVLSDGTVVTPDGQVGYYDENGRFVEGLPAGAVVDANGNTVLPDGTVITADGQVGHYDENGNFVADADGINGKWVDGEGNPLAPTTSRYDAEGNLVSGFANADGSYYDSQGNLHTPGENGYFDANGTWRDGNGEVGYYDSQGIYHEGTNPYKGGYYDSDGNWHPAGEAGYYDKTGTYYSPDGKVGYFDENGVFHLGVNPYTDGYYDANGNFHPFGEDGYFDVDGNWVATLNFNEKYQVGSTSYILYEGYFRDPTKKNMYRAEGNTIQFTVNKSAKNPIYIDTGFYVSQNAILEYDEAQDVLHNIAVRTGNIFVKDRRSCMLVYNGKIVSLTYMDYVSVSTLKELFMDTNVEIQVRKSRVGGKYAFVEAVETNQNITMNIDGVSRTFKNDLVVRNNQVYIALSELADLMPFDIRIKNSRGEQEVRMMRNDNSLRAITQRVEFRTNDDHIYIESTIGEGNVPTITPPVMVDGQTYIPVNMLPSLIGKKVVWNSYTYTLMISDYDYDFIPTIKFDDSIDD